MKIKLNHLISKPLKKALLLLLVIVIPGFLIACGSDTSTSNGEVKTYTVKPETLHKTLFFTGTIQPLKEYTITNPMDAIVETMPYHFGQRVKKHETVFILNSTELQKQYNDILTEYLKAKDAFMIAKAKFVGTEDLWTAGLISKNNYLSEKSSLNNTRVSLMQSTRKLSEMIEKMGDRDNYHLSSLNLTEFDKVQQALSKKHNQLFLKAPNEGVLLYPPKSGSDQSSHLSVGSSVKNGEVLALIGDMSGVRVEIDVPEVDIDAIKPGMKASIRSVAFPKDVLQGELTTVNAQASSAHNGTLPSFSALVEVKQLTPEQKSWIKVGMSATIELAADSTDKLMVPIAAVRLQRGQNLVKVRSKSGEINEINVTTGAAQADKVIIESGLNAGDVVIYG